MTTIALPDMSHMLAIPLEKVCFIAIRAREFEAKDVGKTAGPGSNPADEDMRPVLDDRSDHPVDSELKGFIEALNEDEQIDLVALAWLGRDGSSAAEWTEIRTNAAEARNAHTADHLLGMPLLAACLGAGLSILETSRETIETDHL